MALIVQKYGGTSVGSLERIQHVATKIIEQKQQGHDVVVVISAMQGETDKLVKLAHKLTPNPDLREYDALIATGEQVSAALLTIALIAKHYPSLSFNGRQAGIETDSCHTRAKILNINAQNIKRELSAGKIVIVSGFQGVDELENVTTLGRGGSDTTAVALAVSLQAQECQIYTDVDGVYTSDPNFILCARLIPFISFREMLEMSSLGAKVLQVRAVEFASKHKMPIRVLSSFHEGNGTLVTDEEYIMQKSAVSGVVFSKAEAIISISGLPNYPGVEGYILDKFSQEHIELDLITQSAIGANNMSFTFSVQRKNFISAWNLASAIANEMKSASINNNPKVAKLSIVGLGMKAEQGVASTMLQALGKAGISIYMITTSEVRISVLIDEEHLETGVQAVHRAFELDEEQSYSQPASVVKNNIGLVV